MFSAPTQQRKMKLLLLSIAILGCVLLSAEAKNVQNLKRTVSKTVRSDALSEAISLIDEYGQVKGYQLPMRAFKRKQNDVTRGYSITYQQDYTRAAWGKSASFLFLLFVLLFVLFFWFICFSICFLYYFYLLVFELNSASQVYLFNWERANLFMST
jgi:hypothetical protein